MKGFGKSGGFRIGCAALLAWLIIFVPYSAYANMPAGKHRGAVTAIQSDAQGRILSVGEDGFLGIWDNRYAQSRFQLSPYRITSMVLHPLRSEISIIESDGFGLYRVSAWDYESKKNLFTLRFRNPVSHINYSAAGSFLIIAQSGLGGVIFADSVTGELLEKELQGSPPSAALAVTSRAERVMICYFPLGLLSYWNLETGEKIRSFVVPHNIRSPILFGSDRFIAGFDPSGLIVLDAVNGTILARNESLRSGIIFLENSDSARFFTLSFTANAAALYLMEINPNGQLNTINRRAVPSSITDIRSAAYGGRGGIFLGTQAGELWFLDRNEARQLRSSEPKRITEAAVSSSTIALITETGKRTFIPLDFSLFEPGDTITLDDAESRTNIITDRSASPCSFLFWQSGSRTIPVLINADTGYSYPLNFQPRFPIRTAAIYGSYILLLDTTGTATILDRSSGNTVFTHSVPGSVDAIFARHDTIIFARSAAMGRTPFLSVNILTGETVAFAYPALLGGRAYRGASGILYGAVITRSEMDMQTSILRLNTLNPALSEILFEYDGEDTIFGMAESAGNLASTLGGSGAALNLSGQRVYFERCIGLPVKIFDGGSYFVILDGEGGITWHDNQNGKILAVFRLYSHFWVLEKKNQTELQREIIRGTISLP